MSNPIMRLFKEPAVYFLLIGASIFALYNMSQPARDARMDGVILVDETTQQWIYSNFTKQFSRPPTRSEMDTLIRVHIVSEVKYRHAIEMGLDEQDSIIRRRMAQKFDFLFGNAAADSLPSDDVLQKWYTSNSGDFLNPPTISFSHLYFSPDRRKNPSSDAAKVLKAIREGMEPDSDTFPFEVEFNDATPAEVRSVLGADFVEAVFEIPAGSWSGPVRSGLGYHLVHVSRVTQGGMPPLESIRDAVLQDWRAEESDRILQNLIDELTDQFEIDIDSRALTLFEYSENAGAISR
jgi:peptidyl-prolyl cis-trans isomerase C